MNALTIIINNLDNIILGLTIGTQALSIYYVGTIIPRKIKPLIKPTLFVFLPFFSKNKKSLNKNHILIICIISLSISLILVFSLPIITKILFPEYMESVKFGQGLSPYIAFMPFNIIFELFFKANKMSLEIKKILITPKIIYIILLVPMTYLLNIWGLIICLVLEQLITFVINIIQFIKINNNKSYEKSF